MNRIGLYVVLLSLILCGGCDTGTNQRLNCICLIDYSGSLSEQTLHLYVETISSDVLRRLGEKDRLVVLPIDEGAKTEAVKLVSEDLAEMRFLYHSDGYAHAKDSLRMRLQRYADLTGPRIASQLLREKELRQKYTYLSDIFAAIEQAAALIERNEPDSFWEGIRRFVTGRKRIESTNTILIFSDMIQESSECSFAGPEGCSPGLADTTLERLRTSNRLPDLTTCTVFVNGRTGDSNFQVESIKSFWTRYFRESHAELAAYDYDAGSQITSFLAKRLTGTR
jgi:hypothetical protein